MEFEQLEKLAFEAETSVNADITSGKITPATIDQFKTLHEGMMAAADEFYTTLQHNLTAQIIAYGASETTAKLCKGISENLKSAKNRGDNPIAAERLVERKYLFYLQLVISGLKITHKTKAISNENYNLINDSLRTLVRLADEDNIYRPELTENEAVETAVANAINAVEPEIDQHD
ncbi:hypothetical protein COX86_01455 [Candidatus Micrarchaeota archaeon CG_4_10_14_0_2_um_filter_60_11]|nr:MAG: hypothetical protein AUJ16_01285 [Candidatus Micrarchaeota archaeon CG1_02_60_51]PIN96360.1 MAG: hypothetical protein COU39_01690 [Candidatus Micrarchaeota archaeon CG10_big_fil_rev_8_21_14_0_10_60_32]PIO02039.1 MAG: hypothetical protein COT58_02030 [Candidatus Micrarchaeota archaeon CG09_land_8_20_14_0_10_60_16]PIY91840.1 MAG: hypothetical protein COY71_01015 [Candidatus Micrarchaeota archaeon CG_4_10_14_0_8_um_filter_60_7]PIZ91127.1 MAG: hypothetical protein COX86_01455 [Candidatus Mi